MARLQAKLPYIPASPTHKRAPAVAGQHSRTRAAGDGKTMLRQQIDELARTYVHSKVTVEELNSPRVRHGAYNGPPVGQRRRAGQHRLAGDPSSTQPLQQAIAQHSEAGGQRRGAETFTKLPVIESPNSKRNSPVRQVAGVPCRPEWYPAPPPKERAAGPAATGFDLARLAAYRRRPEGNASAYSSSGHTEPATKPKQGQYSKNTDPLAPYGLKTLGPIAAGAFSTVVRAQRRGGEGGDEESAEVAVKSFHRQKYQREPWLRQALKNELEVLTTLQPSRHAHVANLLEVHEAPAATHAILEYCSGGSVHRKLKSLRHGHGLTEQHVAMLTYQVAAALAHLHAHKIAHRDVKPETVLYTDASRAAVKLCDFGFACVCGEKRLKTVCGSPAYMAPELCAKEPYFGPPVDVWALGCFAFEGLHGLAAFRASDMATLMLRIRRGDHTPLSKSLGAETRRLIKQQLTVDTDERPSAEAVVAGWAQVLKNAAPADLDGEVDRRQPLPQQVVF